MKLALVMALILSGCSATNVSNRQISAFKNDELCKALGTYNNDGPTVLRLTTELERRGMSINQERCYALSRMNMNRRDYIVYGDTNNNMGNLQQERNERYQKQEEQQRLQTELQQQRWRDQITKGITADLIKRNQ